MTLPGLQACLDRLGVRLSARGDRLHYRAPAGVLTPEIKAELATHKPALLAVLAGVASAHDGPPARIDPGPAAVPEATDETNADDVEQPPPAESATPPPWPPRPAELAEWPVEWRAKWGVRANELQDQGIPWPEHERQAFYMVKAEMEAHYHGQASGRTAFRRTSS
jgi:hypothetical protein